MAYSKKPTYSFENANSNGINKVPQGRIVVVESYEGTAKSFMSGDTSSLQDTTTIKEAVTQGKLTELSAAEESLNQTKVLTPGKLGFGCGVCSTELAKEKGLTGMPGFESVDSPNYGNYQDKEGSVFVFIPKFYFKWEKNKVLISDTEQSGYVIHRAFINAGKELDGFFIGKYQMSANGLSKKNVAVWHSVQGNAYLAKAQEKNDTLSKRQYTIINVFMFNALAILAKAQSQAGRNAAWMDVPPYLPKGNNNRGSDVNDSSVRFTGSEPAYCGSGVPFAKTTHNGQNCGVADLHGNVWEFALGITCDGAKYYYVKESTDFTKFVNTVGTGASNAVQHAWGDTAYLNNPNGFYEELSTTGIPYGGSSEHISFGNADNQVFPFTTNKNDQKYVQCCAGIPLTSGSMPGSSAGTEEFGNDVIYYVNRKTNHLMLLLGGCYGDSADAGVFPQHLSCSRMYSSQSCGSRLAIL